MSQNLPNMLDSTIAKIREMLNANSVVGEPVVTADGVTIIPISKISVGYGGGGAEFEPKNSAASQAPFGGGVGAGIKVVPVAFLVVKNGSVRVLPVAIPANTTADRVVEMIPETLDKIIAVFEGKQEKKS